MATMGPNRNESVNGEVETGDLVLISVGKCLQPALVTVPSCNPWKHWRTGQIYAHLKVTYPSWDSNRAVTITREPWGVFKINLQVLKDWVFFNGDSMQQRTWLISRYEDMNNVRIAP